MYMEFSYFTKLLTGAFNSLIISTFISTPNTQIVPTAVKYIQKIVNLFYHFVSSGKSNWE